MYYSYYCNEKMLLDNFDDTMKARGCYGGCWRRVGMSQIFVQICSWPIQTPST